MKKVRRIQCAFCRGGGRHPYYFSTPCTVCKGKGENEVVGEVQTCQYCKGNGRKSTTTLACFYCGGLGVVPGSKKGQKAPTPARPPRIGETGYPDKGVIREVVEETLKKYRLKGLKGVRREEAAVIKRVPVSGVLREEEEMKAYAEPISGTRIESASSINQSVASLFKLKEESKPATFEERVKVERSADMLANMKKGGR